ncbi:hypothetical protein Mapa_011964 [Marchantia paleacea]|nr:hypothetical protein Mapa_011964 [Marchantia paleacea]
MNEQGRNTAFERSPRKVLKLYLPSRSQCGRPNKHSRAWFSEYTKGSTSILLSTKTALKDELK